MKKSTHHLWNYFWQSKQWHWLVNLLKVEKKSTHPFETTFDDQNQSNFYMNLHFIGSGRPAHNKKTKMITRQKIVYVYTYRPTFQEILFQNVIEIDIYVRFEQFHLRPINYEVWRVHVWLLLATGFSAVQHTNWQAIYIERATTITINVWDALCDEIVDASKYFIFW